MLRICLYLPYMHHPSPGTRQMEISWPLEASPSSALTRWRTCMPKVGYTGTGKLLSKTILNETRHD